MNLLIIKEKLLDERRHYRGHQDYSSGQEHQNRSQRTRPHYYRYTDSYKTYAICFQYYPYIILFKYFEHF